MIMAYACHASQPHITQLLSLGQTVGTPPTLSSQPSCMAAAPSSAAPSCMISQDEEMRLVLAMYGGNKKALPVRTVKFL